MTIDERKNNNSQNVNTVQNIVLENREKLSISGVLDVLSFDDQIVILETELGLLIIDGEIFNLGYSEKDMERKNQGGFLNKLFR